MKSLFVRFVRDDQGQDLIEYAMLATVIALAVYTAAQAAGTAIKDWYNGLHDKIETWVPA
ncbi:MAG TPA: Flp family type IVb pilin [Vicinamibacterales bacterium]|nr:Flp family type IVb pilin [Vicinamibacterales bacterium]